MVEVFRKRDLNVLPRAQDVRASEANLDSLWEKAIELEQLRALREIRATDGETTSH